jgi:hypothetical protein
MRLCKALMGLAVTQDWRGRTRAKKVPARVAIRNRMKLCVFCHLNWTKRTTCSAPCARGMVRLSLERRERVRRNGR